MIQDMAVRFWRSPIMTATLRRSMRPAAIAMSHFLAAPPLFDSRKVPAEGPGPIVVSRFASESFGIARGGRLTEEALRAAGLDPATHDVRRLLLASRYAEAPLPPLPDGGGGVWLVHANPPEALALFSRIPLREWRPRYRIGYWAWELPAAPRLWLRAARLFHEVWAPSRYVAESLAGAAAPVRVVPHPVPVSAARPDRARFGLDESRVWALAMADFCSSAARKNPFGAVEAFVRAFPEPQAEAGLLVKLLRPDFDPAAGAKLRSLIGGRSDVRVLDRVLADEEMDALVASIDIYLSLHRAEGFGLGLAEAMACGRVCLATAWSGNLDFMEGLDPMLVPFRLTPVRDPSRVYEAPGQMWAEPDLDAAAQKLRTLCADAELRARLAAEGLRRIGALRAPWERARLEDMGLLARCAPGGPASPTAAAA